MTDNGVQGNGLSVKWKARKASHPDPKLDIDVLGFLLVPCSVHVNWGWGVLSLRTFQR